MQEHTAWLEQNAKAPYTDWVANLSQRASHMPPTPHVPALLKNSTFLGFLDQLYPANISSCRVGICMEMQIWALP